MTFTSRTKIFENMQSITSEMAFTESLLLRKGHFLSRKRGRLFKKYFFRSLNGAFKPKKRALFSLLKKVGGHMPQLPPPPRFRGPCQPLTLTPNHNFFNFFENLTSKIFLKSKLFCFLKLF
jgi:hypothetical protein